MSFGQVTLFENKIAEFYGAPYAVAVDCCTHGLELCLRYNKEEHFLVPKHTYLSVPMLADKLNIKRTFLDDEWENYYYITDNIIDAAVYWKENSYIHGTFMVLSFQFQKHLSLGRGGMILTDKKEAAHALRCMSYDGRDNTTGPWGEQNIETVGYHYYMTPEIAMTGLKKLPEAIATEPVRKGSKDYPDLRKMSVFANK